MRNKTVFSKDDLILPADDAQIPDDGYLPSRKRISGLFENGPLRIKLIISVECTCGSNNGNHQKECPITVNHKHNQIIVIACSDVEQVQFSAAFFKKTNTC